MLMQRGDGRVVDHALAAVPRDRDEAYARVSEVRQAAEFGEWWRLTLALGIDAATLALLLADHPGPQRAGDRDVVHTPSVPGAGRAEQFADAHGLRPVVHRPLGLPPKWVHPVERGCAQFVPPAPTGARAAMNDAADRRDAG